MMDRMVAIILGMRDIRKLGILLGITARRLGELREQKASEVLHEAARMMEVIERNHNEGERNDEEHRPG